MDDQFSTFNSSHYFQYPDTWRDTSGNGRYGAPITSDGTKLRIKLYSDSTGPRVAALVPQPGGTGDHLGWRYELRIRADRLLGYKGVPLLWPASGVWPRDGEIDWPESHLETQPKAYLHHQGASSGSDQTVFSSPAGTTWQDWHTYEVRWKPGTSVEFYIDGVMIGRSTNRIPSTAMHLVMQFETATTGVVPDPATSGYVEVDYLRMWKLN